MSLSSLANKPHGLSAPAVMEFAFQTHPDVRHLTAGWLWLALTALALSTLCAVLLIAARTPGVGGLVGWGELFGRALVLHVSLAVVVWFLACAAAFWTFAGGAAAGILTWVALALAGTGLLAMVLALALAWSGSLGVPRKTLHVDVIVQYQAYFAAMGLAGLGGLLALSSGDDAGTVVTMPADPRVDATGHAAQQRKAEVDRRFAQGVAHLNNRQYEAAASELHRVLELAPKMPEAHVNMGYAMIGAQRYPMARDFFNSALELNAMQLNAYYGLAVALEGLKDMPGAVGAMRSYVHLSKPDDPYLVKANAALWEWEAELKVQREGTRP